MKLEHCRYLLEVNRLHSISAAAQSLHIGQTTLSAIVKRMEEEFGFAIFQRTPTGVTATASGERLLEQLWEISVVYEDLLRVKKRDASSVPTITLLIAPTISMRLALPLSSRFAQLNVPGNLVFEDTPSELICEQILDNTANLGLTYLTDEEIAIMQSDCHKQDVYVEKLLTDELCIMVSKDHYLAGKEFVEMQEIMGESLTTVSPARRDKIIGSFADHSTRITRFSSFDDMCQAVLRYGLVGFAPKFLGEYGYEYTFADFRLIPLRKTEKENRMYICLITCKNRNLRYQEEIAVSCIHDYFQGLNLSNPTAENKE